MLNWIMMVSYNQRSDWLFLSRISGYLRSNRILARLILPLTRMMLFVFNESVKMVCGTGLFRWGFSCHLTFPITSSQSVAQQRSNLISLLKTSWDLWIGRWAWFGLLCCCLDSQRNLTHTAVKASLKSYADLYGSFYTMPVRHYLEGDATGCF